MIHLRQEPTFGHTQTGEPKIEQFSRAERRRMAFETNLNYALDEEPSLALDATARTRLVQALSSAFHATRHGIEARTGMSRTPWPFYLVLFAGVTRRRGGPASTLTSPFAEALLARTHGIGIRFTPEQLKAIGRSIDRAEVSKKHSLDKRFVIRMPWLRAYFTLIGGRSRRLSSQTTTPERRAPANPSLGALFFVFLALWLAGFGLFMVTATIYALTRLLNNDISRTTVTELFTRMFGG